MFFDVHLINALAKLIPLVHHSNEVCLGKELSLRSKPTLIEFALIALSKKPYLPVIRHRIRPVSFELRSSHRIVEKHFLLMYG